MAFSTIQGSGGAPDSFVGTSGVDSITLIDNAGNFFLGAQQSNDFIGFTSTFLDSGLTSTATLKGGQGSDTFSNIGNVTFVGSFFNGNSDADNLGANGASIQLITSTLQGGQGADTIFLDVTSNSLINGNKDNDTITLGTDGGAISSSSVYGGQGNDTINTTAAVPAAGFAPTTAASVISADDGDDRVTLANAAFTTSTVLGGAGNDTLNAGALVAGNDVVIEGGDGLDDITGGAGTDTISGGAGVDAIAAGGGNDIVDGGDGDDNINGDAGNDTITGGNGADGLTGGAGAGDADNFRYAAGISGSGQTGAVTTGAVDRLVDFATTADVISGLGVAGTTAGEYTEAAGTSGWTYANALAAANGIFAGAPTQSYYYTTFGTDGATVQGVLFLNMDNNTTADGSILIGNANAAATQAAGLLLFAPGDILA